MPSPMTPFAVNPTNPQQLALMAGLNAPKPMMQSPTVLPVQPPSNVGIAAGAPFNAHQAQQARAQAAMLAGENVKQNTVIGARLDLARQVLQNETAERLQIESERRAATAHTQQLLENQQDRENALTKELAMKRQGESIALNQRNAARPQTRIQMAEDIYAHTWWNFGNKYTYTTKKPNLTGRELIAGDERIGVLRRGAAMLTPGGEPTDLGTGGDIEGATWGGEDWLAKAEEIIMSDPEKAKAVQAEVDRILKERDAIYDARKKRAEFQMLPKAAGGYGITPDMEGFRKIVKKRYKKSKAASATGQGRTGLGTPIPVTPMPTPTPTTPVQPTP